MNLLSRRRALMTQLKKFIRTIFGSTPLTIYDGLGEDAIDYKIDGNSVQGKLPHEYQQVEYIESTGTQYIDTGIIPNQDTGFDITFLTKNDFNTSTYGSIMGARENSLVNELQLTTFTNGDSKGIFRYGDSGHDAGLVQNEKVNVKLLNKVYTDSFGVARTLNKTFTCPVNLTLFALNNNETIVQWGKVQLYDLKLYDGSTLIRHFVPCYRKADNVIGLYDVVNGVFYENAGTGTFLKGEETTGYKTTPTPDNQIMVESVGEKTKNLLDITSLIDNKVVIDNKDSTYSLIKVENNIRFGPIAELYIPANTPFTISVDILEHTGTHGYAFNVQFIMEDGTNQYSNFFKNNTYKTHIFETSVKSIRLYSQSSNPDESYVKFKNLMIEEGEVATSYEPYGYKLPITISSKNLCSSEYVVYQDSDDYSNFSIDNNTLISTGNTYIGFLAKVEPNTTYTVSYYQDGTNFTENSMAQRVREYTGYPTKWAENYNKQLSASWGSDTQRKITTITTTGEAKYIALTLYTNGEGMKVSKFQVELGSVATGYEPYQESVETTIYIGNPLHKVGDYADYIDFENKKVVRQVAAQVLDGTETWTRHTVSSEGYGVFKNSGYLTPLIGALQTATFMTCGVVTDKGSTKNFLTNEYMFQGSGGKISSGLIYLGSNQVTEDEFTTWLAENKPMIYYPLSIPLEHNIDLPVLPTFPNTTIYNIDTALQPSRMEVTYQSRKKG